MNAQQRYEYAVKLDANPAAREGQLRQLESASIAFARSDWAIRHKVTLLETLRRVRFDSARSVSVAEDCVTITVTPCERATRPVAQITFGGSLS